MATVLIRALARLFSWLGVVALVAMVGANVVDVGLRHLLDIPVFGTHEIVELCLAAVAFLAVAEVFLRDDHIVVELIDHVLPPRGVAFLRLFGALLAVAFLGVLTWRMVGPAVDLVTFNEVSFDLGIPRIYPAALILAGIAAAGLAALVALARALARLRRGEGGGE